MMSRYLGALCGLKLLPNFSQVTSDYCKLYCKVKTLEPRAIRRRRSKEFLRGILLTTGHESFRGDSFVNISARIEHTEVLQKFLILNLNLK